LISFRIGSPSPERRLSRWITQNNNLWATVVVGTLAVRVLNGMGELLDLGLYGFNLGLVGLALGNFFQPEPMLRLWVVVFALLAAAVTVAWSKWIPVPFLAAPFILSFWAAWLLAEPLGLT
jgi:urea transporter